MTSFFTNEETTQQVKDAADIVEIIGEHVSLKKAGISYKGHCPFHSEKTPSFLVNPSRRSYHCFGCGEGGDVFSFLMRYNNLGFPDAVKQVADRYNIALPEKPLSSRERQQAQKRKNIYRINEEAVALYHDCLLNEPVAASARRYLKKRQIPDSVVKAYKLGFAPDSWDYMLKKMHSFSVKDVEASGLIVPNNRGGHYDRFRNRVLFPIYSAAGQALGFGGRILGDQQPKYLNSPESPVYNKSKILFGLYQNKEAIRRQKQCLVVEGNFDLLALVSREVGHVVAPLGTALTANHVRSLKGFVNEAIILFDGDRAGVKAALQAVPLFLREQLPAKVVVLPEKHDPDTFIAEFGRDHFSETVNQAHPLPEFVFDRLVSEHGLSLAGKAAIVNDLKPIIEAVGDHKLQRSLFVSHFSEKLGLTSEQMLQGVPVRGSSPKIKKAEVKPPASLTLSKVEEHLLEFLIIYPEFLDKFMENGLQYAIESSAGRIILHHLTANVSENHKDSPEHLLDSMSGLEREFVSRCLMEVKEITDQEREDESLEKITWLRENFRKGRMKELTALIKQAQQGGDEKLLMELLLEKNKMRD